MPIVLKPAAINCVRGSSYSSKANRPTLPQTNIVFFAGVGRHGQGHDLGGGQVQVGRSQRGGVVAHLAHGVDGDLELQFGLFAKTLGDVADVDADDRPALFLRSSRNSE